MSTDQFAPDVTTATPDRRAWSWATWPVTLVLIAVWLVLRLIHLRWFYGADLLGDEANYWECARRLQLSYHYSGPGVAAVVAAAVALFGNVEWGMRIPAAIAMALTALLVGRMAIRMSGDERAGFFAVALFLLLPLTTLWSTIITYDPLYMTCWMLATCSAWMILQAHRQGRWPGGWWVALGLALGLGFLLKYSIILFVPGLLIYLVVQRRTVRWDARMWGGLALALVIFIAAISPVLIWNQQEGWPTITYLRGHLNRPTDTREKPWTPLWIPDYVGSQLAVMGPPAVALLIGAALAAWRRRRLDATRWDSELLLLCCGGSIIVFFFLTTFLAKSQGNWALAGYPPLAVLIGLHLARELPAWSRLTRRGWAWTLGFGVFCYLIVWSPQASARLPLLGPVIPLERFHGARQLAQEVQRLREQVRAQTGQDPLLIAKTYLTASQMAFYLPDHPTTYAAASYLGWRRNTYDFWADTDMTDPRLLGRPAILLSGEAGRWQEALQLGGLTTVTLKPKPIFLVTDYQGVRPEVLHRGRIR